MEDTYIMDEPGELFTNRADSYTLSSRGGFRQVYDNSTVQGAGGVYTTVGDLAKWLLNLRTARVGGEAVCQQMLTRGILNNGDTLDYAYGLILSEYRGLRRIWHTGSSAGYRNIFSYYPDLELGFLVKSNRTDFGGSSIVDELDAYLLTPHYTEPAPVRGPRAAADDPKPLALGPEALAPYTGRYYSPELGTVYQLVIENGQLTARHARNEPVAMTPAAVPDEFTAREGAFREAVFERGTDGQITGVRISNGRVLRLWLAKME
jgi:CubicO group peptidase (beta-lactamase class C family)